MQVVLTGYDTGEHGANTIRLTRASGGYAIGQGGSQPKKTKLTPGFSNRAIIQNEVKGVTGNSLLPSWRKVSYATSFAAWG
jgi:hypothetical protein